MFDLYFLSLNLKVKLLSNKFVGIFLKPFVEKKISFIVRKWYNVQFTSHNGAGPKSKKKVQPPHTQSSRSSSTWNARNEHWWERNFGWTWDISGQHEPIWCQKVHRQRWLRRSMDCDWSSIWRYRCSKAINLES